MLRRMICFIAFLLPCLCGGCTPRKSAPDDAEFEQLAKRAIEKPLPPEETKQLMSEVGGNWLYGQGVGETALTVGGIVLFPPYALYVLGNAALSISGYEPLSVSRALPEEAGKKWEDAYDTVTSQPGHLTATIAGEDFRSKKVATERIKKVLAGADAAQSKNSAHLAALDDNAARGRYSERSFQIQKSKMGTERYEHFRK